MLHQVSYFDRNKFEPFYGTQKIRRLGPTNTDQVQYNPKVTTEHTKLRINFQNPDYWKRIEKQKSLNTELALLAEDYQSGNLSEIKPNIQPTMPEIKTQDQLGYIAKLLEKGMGLNENMDERPKKIGEKRPPSYRQGYIKGHGHEKKKTKEKKRVLKWGKYQKEL